MATDRFVVDGAQPVDLGPVIRDLRKVDRALPKVIQQANKAVSTEVAGYAKDRLGSIAGAAGGPVRALAASKIRPRGKQRSASIALLGGSRKKYDAGPQAFEFGTRFHFLPWRRGDVQATGRSGFVPVSSLSRPIFPPWVGNKFDGGDWKDGVHGKRGHIVAPSVQRGIDSGDFNEKYADYIERAFAIAFPEVT